MKVKASGTLRWIRKGHAQILTIPLPSSALDCAAAWLVLKGKTEDLVLPN